MNGENISKKVAAYRQQNELTIQQMAAKTGLSTAIISQIERNLANPTLSVLTTLAHTLGISLAELVAEEIEEESLVLRAEKREKIYNPDDKYMFYNMLTPTTMKSNFQVRLVHIEPHSHTFGENFHQHHVEEIVFVLEGTVTALFEFSSVELHQGDTLRVPPNKKHRYSNETQKVVELLTIKTIRNY